MMGMVFRTVRPQATSALSALVSMICHLMATQRIQCNDPQNKLLLMQLDVAGINWVSKSTTSRAQCFFLFTYLYVTHYILVFPSYVWTLAAAAPLPLVCAQ